VSAAEIIAALDAETAKAADAPTSLVSVTLDVVGEGQPEKTEVQIVRATKSLVFSTAEARDANGARVIAASAVHKILR